MINQVRKSKLITDSERVRLLEGYFNWKEKDHRLYFHANESDFETGEELDQFSMIKKLFRQGYIYPMIKKDILGVADQMPINNDPDLSRVNLRAATLCRVKWKGVYYLVLYYNVAMLYNEQLGNNFAENLKKLSRFADISSMEAGRIQYNFEPQSNRDYRCPWQIDEGLFRYLQFDGIL